MPPKSELPKVRFISKECISGFVSNLMKPPKNLFDKIVDFNLGLPFELVDSAAVTLQELALKDHQLSKSLPATQVLADILKEKRFKWSYPPELADSGLKNQVNILNLQLAILACRHERDPYAIATLLSTNITHLLDEAVSDAMPDGTRQPLFMLALGLTDPDSIPMRFFNSAIKKLHTKESEPEDQLYRAIFGKIIDIADSSDPQKAQQKKRMRSLIGKTLSTRQPQPEEPIFFSAATPQVRYLATLSSMFLRTLRLSNLASEKDKAGLLTNFKLHTEAFPELKQSCLQALEKKASRLSRDQISSSWEYPAALLDLLTKINPWGTLNALEIMCHGYVTKQLDKSEARVGDDPLVTDADSLVAMYRYAAIVDHTQPHSEIIMQNTDPLPQLLKVFGADTARWIRSSSRYGPQRYAFRTDKEPPKDKPAKSGIKAETLILDPILIKGYESTSFDADTKPVKVKVPTPDTTPPDSDINKLTDTGELSKIAPRPLTQEDRLALTFAKKLKDMLSLDIGHNANLRAVELTALCSMLTTNPKDPNHHLDPYLSQLLANGIAPFLVSQIQNRKEYPRVVITKDPLTGKTTGIPEAKDPIWNILELTVPQWSVRSKAALLDAFVKATTSKGGLMENGRWQKLCMITGFGSNHHPDLPLKDSDMEPIIAHRTLKLLKIWETIHGADHPQRAKHVLLHLAQSKGIGPSPHADDTIPDWIISSDNTYHLFQLQTGKPEGSAADRHLALDPHNSLPVQAINLISWFGTDADNTALFKQIQEFVDQQSLRDYLALAPPPLKSVFEQLANSIKNVLIPELEVLTQPLRQIIQNCRALLPTTNARNQQINELLDQQLEPVTHLLKTIGDGEAWKIPDNTAPAELISTAMFLMPDLAEILGTEDHPNLLEKLVALLVLPKLQGAQITDIPKLLQQIKDSGVLAPALAAAEANADQINARSQAAVRAGNITREMVRDLATALTNTADGRVADIMETEAQALLTIANAFTVIRETRKTIFDRIQTGTKGAADTRYYHVRAVLQWVKDIQIDPDRKTLNLLLSHLGVQNQLTPPDRQAIENLFVLAGLEPVLLNNFYPDTTDTLLTTTR